MPETSTDTAPDSDATAVGSTTAPAPAATGTGTAADSSTTAAPASEPATEQQLAEAAQRADDATAERDRLQDDFLDAADEPDPATAFRMWPTDIAERDQAHKAMQDGDRYTFCVADRQTRYRMSILPVPVGALPSPDSTAPLAQKEAV